MFKKLRQCRKKWSVVSGLILQEHKGSHKQQNYIEIYVQWGDLGQGVNGGGAVPQLEYEFYM